MELSLVSGTEACIASIVNPDIHIQLNKYRSISQPSAAYPWKSSKVVCSLKDRLLIEWIFCQRESMKALHDIITSIESKISSNSSRRNSKTLQSLVVGISCPNGICLSPSFVEKLYDHYYYSPPFDELKVTRTHTAFPLPVTVGCQWQQLPSVSKFSRHKKSFENIQQLRIITTCRDWSPLPGPLSAKMEESFRKDPLNTRLIIGDVHVDFVEGSLFNKSTGQKSFIRCFTELPQAYVTVRELHDTTSYQSSIRGFEAAGILPYSIHPLTGEAIFLVGQLTYDGGTWCDFGGLKSKYILRNETPAETAARECYEETLGVLGTSKDLLESLRSYTVTNTFKVVNETCRYVGHFLRVHFDHYPGRFASEAVKKLASYEELEVNAMRWIPLSTIRQAVSSTLAGGGSCSIEACSINESNGEYDNSLLRLRWEFAQSLCMADRLGVLDSIEHITSEIWKSSRHDKRREEDLIKREQGGLEDPQELASALAGVSLEGGTAIGGGGEIESEAHEIFKNKSKRKTFKSYGMGAGTFHRNNT